MSFNYHWTKKPSMIILSQVLMGRIPEHVFIIDEDLCYGCAACIALCPINIIELKDRLVAINRVTKVTKGGRNFGFSAIVVVGDEAGVVGQGLGKSKDVASAIAKAVEDAKKNLVRIPLIKGTLPHEQKGKYGGARVNIIPAAPGTGVIAGGAVRTVLEAVGVHDVLSKSQGSSNPHNVVKATFDALLQLRDAKSIARERGISLSKVFNG